MNFRIVRCLVSLIVAAVTALAADAVPKRIVSLSPNTTEILYGVGAFPRVVGVSQFCTFPPEVAKLPRVGGWQTSDVEKIVLLHPDLVVLTEAQRTFIADKLSAFGLRWVAVPSKTLADVFSAIDMIGQATGDQKQAAELKQSTRASLDQIRARVSKLPRRTILVSVNRTPGTLNDLYVATQGSYLIDLVELAGAVSVTSPAKTGYEKMTKEAILALNPSIIIDLVHGSKARFGEHVADVWNDLPELRAVREKHIYPVDDPFIPHASQYVAHTAEIFEKIIHPEAFGQGAK